MIPSTSPPLSRVERTALAGSPLDCLCCPPAEQFPVITVGSFPALGKLAAMRFLEWVQDHPGGVIALPTGKTPEHFIHWVSRLLATWESTATRSVLAAAGVDPDRRPDVASLHFVQIDEFYPIHPSQQNSFYWYVTNFYLEGFHLDAAKALLINCAEIALGPGQTLESVWPGMRVDLSLRTRRAQSDLEKTQQAVLHRIDQWCQEYEERIRALGGIGFFLGGIGPDGHIAFNVRGSDHFSTTRLTATNYETQAAAAGDLGGIEVARQRLAITIGLGTITMNPECTAVIMAAGEAKAGVVARAVEAPRSVLVPASALRALPNARLYLTVGAARKLRERQVRLAARSDAASDRQVEAALLDLALERNKRVLDLSAEDVRADPMAAVLLGRRAEPLATLSAMVHERLVGKIEAGSRRARNTRFLHTEPHHDDLMLGCLPYIVRNVRDASNVHYFVTFTSGFTAVTNHLMLDRFERLRPLLQSAGFAALQAEGYFDPANRRGRDRDVWQYLDGVAARDDAMRDEGAARRLLRNLVEVYEQSELRAVAGRLAELEDYFRTVYPGKKDPAAIQRLKGMCREWEAECLWGYFGWQTANVRHLRLRFYTGDIFSPAPTVQGDVPPVVALLAETAPDVVSTALDPEASGPDTHYKVLQTISEALRQHAARTGRRDLRIVGYRNVWQRFHPAEADVYVPVSLNMFSVMDSAFRNTFVSQREASFPSPEHDGPFCELAEKIQVEQYQAMKTCLGRAWFAEHASPLIRATRGLVFLAEMTVDELSHRARALRQSTETLAEEPAKP
jgi:glucosamine-6-phosphate deaminase